MRVSKQWQSFHVWLKYLFKKYFCSQTSSENVYTKEKINNPLNDICRLLQLNRVSRHKTKLNCGKITVNI